MKHQVISAYGEKTKNHGIKFTQPSLTKQSFTKECDINTILAKYQKTGAIDHVNKHEASYGFATSLGFQEALELVAKGQKMFEELPSTIRTKFENDPGKFLDFVQNPENIKEMQELGLATKNEIKNEKVEETIPAKKAEGQIPEGDAKTEPSGTAKTGSD